MQNPNPSPPTSRGARALAAFALALAAAAPASAQTPAIVASDTNVAGVVAEVTECKRKEGVLSLKLRFRNTGATEADFNLIEGRNHDKLYVTAADKKYFVLRDSEKTPVSAQEDAFGNLRVKLAPGASWTWWAKYPAPPPEIEAVSYYTTVGPPIEDIPVTDM
jgi:hypothetical protein